MLRILVPADSLDGDVAGIKRAQDFALAWEKDAGSMCLWVEWPASCAEPCPRRAAKATKMG